MQAGEDPRPLDRVEQVAVAVDEAVLDVAFSPDGRLLATASEDGTARVWALPDGRELQRLSHVRDAFVRHPPAMLLNYLERFETERPLVRVML